MIKEDEWFNKMKEINSIGGTLVLEKSKYDEIILSNQNFKIPHKQRDKEKKEIDNDSNDFFPEIVDLSFNKRNENSHYNSLITNLSIWISYVKEKQKNGYLDAYDLYRYVAENILNILSGYKEKTKRIAIYVNKSTNEIYGIIIYDTVTGELSWSLTTPKNVFNIKEEEYIKYKMQNTYNLCAYKIGAILRIYALTQLFNMHKVSKVISRSISNKGALGLRMIGFENKE